MKKLYALLAGCFVFMASQAQIYSFTNYNTESSKTKSKLYMGEINAGVTFGGKYKMDGHKFDESTNSFFFETIHGLRVHKYVFVGLGVGVHYYYDMGVDYQNAYEAYGSRSYKDECYFEFPIAIPLFVNLKGFCPINDRLKAYMGTSLGYAWTGGTDMDIDTYEWVRNSWSNYWQHVGYDDRDVNGGFYGTFEVGLQWKKLNVALGLTHQTLNPDYEGMKPVKINNFSLKVGLCW